MKKIVNTFGIVSVVYFVIYQLIFLHIPAPYEIMVDIGVILSVASQGIFTGWILYILVEVKQESDRKNKLKRILPVCLKNYAHVFQSPIVRLLSSASGQVPTGALELEDYSHAEEMVSRQEIFMDYIVGGSGLRAAYDGIYEYSRLLAEMLDNSLRYAEFMDDITFDLVFSLRNCNYLVSSLRKFDKATIVRATAGDSLGYNLGNGSIKDYVERSVRLHKRLYLVGVGNLI